MPSVGRYIADFLIRARYLLLAIAIIAGAAAIAPSTQLDFDRSIENMVERNDGFVGRSARNVFRWLGIASKEGEGKDLVAPYKKLKRSETEILFAKPSHPRGKLAGLLSSWKRALLQTKTGRLLMYHVYLPFIAPLKKRVIENPNEAGQRLNLSNELPNKEFFQWTKQNISDFVLLAKNDGVLPILVSQATLVGPDTLDDSAIARAVQLKRVQLTMPALLETWQSMTLLIKDLWAYHTL